MTYKPGDKVLITDAGLYTGEIATVNSVYSDFVGLLLPWGDCTYLDFDQVRKLTKLDLALA